MEQCQVKGMLLKESEEKLIVPDQYLLYEENPKFAGWIIRETLISPEIKLSLAMKMSFLI